MELVDLVEDRLTLVDRRLLDLGAELGDLVAVFLAGVLYVFLDLLGLGAELVVGKFLDFGIGILHLLYDRLDEFHIPRGFVTEE